MHLPMENFFKLGLVHYAIYPNIDDAAWLKTLDYVALDTDFTAVELTSFGANAIHKSVARILEQSKISVVFDAAPRLRSSGLNACDPDSKNAQKSINMLKECINEAAALGAKHLSFQSGSCLRGKEMDALSSLLTTTGTVCDYAKAFGIAVDVEICDFDEDIKALIGPSNLARSFASQMRETQPDFGLSVNLAHLPYMPGTMRDKIGPVKDFITYARIGNTVTEPGNPAYGAKYVRFGYPDSTIGINEMVEYLRTLVFIRYLDQEKQEKPIISIKICLREGDDPRYAIAYAKRMIKEAWAIA